MKLSKQEQWKPVEGWSNLYEVSNLGRVKALDRIYIDSNNIKRLHKGRFMALSSKGKKGYIGVMLYRNTKFKRYYVHRLVAIAFIPNPENKPCVNHIDFNPANNQASNLSWTTYPENNNHSHSFGRYNKQRGSETTNAKLTEEQVLEIKQSLKDGVMGKLLSEKYGVSECCITGIKTGRAWRWLN